jgi:hypothetical protein
MTNYNDIETALKDIFKLLDMPQTIGYSLQYEDFEREKSIKTRAIMISINTIDLNEFIFNENVSVYIKFDAGYNEIRQMVKDMMQDIESNPVFIINGTEHSIEAKGGTINEIDNSIIFTINCEVTSL